MKKLLALAVLLSAATTANANLIQNDSLVGSVTRYSSADIASHRVSFININSHNNSVLAQVMTTSADSLYELLFNHSSHVNHPSSTNSISALWNGVLLDGANGTGNTNNARVTQQFFITESAHDTLQFSTSDINDSLTSNIDEAQLNAVPAPAAAWLFASALCLFGFVRRNSI